MLRWKIGIATQMAKHWVIASSQFNDFKWIVVSEFLVSKYVLSGLLTKGSEFSHCTKNKVFY